MSVLAVIPARGGSKGVPRKNVKPLGGKPLIAWTIDAAGASRHIDRMIVTSDDAEIIEVARSHGCEAPFVRPAELALDDTPGMAPVWHAVAELPGYALVVVLQPTSPFRSTADIDACIEICSSAEVDCCVSLTPATKPPQWMYVRREGGLLEPLLGEAATGERRQDLQHPLVLNGAVYVAHSAWLESGHSLLQGRVQGYEMPAERSLDIDTEWDWYLASRIVDGSRYVR